MATANELAVQQYPGFAWALMIPDIKRVLDDAVREGWPPDRLQAALQGTDWWKQNSDKMRAWISLQNSDPATAERQRQERQQQVQTLASNLGVGLSSDALGQIIDASLRLGWTDYAITQAVLAQAREHPDRMFQGDLSSIESQYAGLASDYLVPISPAALKDWALRTAAGDVGADTFRSYLVEQARSLFPSLGNALDRGITVRQYIDPYVQLAAKELEISPEQVDLRDMKWSRPLFQIDPKTNERTQMSLADWQRTIRTEAQYGWDKTTGARTASAELQQTLLKQFGAI